MKSTFIHKNVSSQRTLERFWRQLPKGSILKRLLKNVLLQHAMGSWRTVRKWETHRRMNPDGFLFIKQPSQVCHLLSLPDSVRQEYFRHFFLRENAKHTEQGRSLESRGTLFTSISERGRTEIRRNRMYVLPKDKRKMGQWLCFHSN